jgi:hypothetical protein
MLIIGKILLAAFFALLTLAIWGLAADFVCWCDSNFLPYSFWVQRAGFLYFFYGSIIYLFKDGKKED